MAEDTRENILKSAVELFSKNNYHAVSMTEIAEGADISKGTLYWHFDSKEELFREIAFKGMDYFQQQFQKIAEKDIGSCDKIRQVIKFVLNTFVDHLSMMDVFRNNIELISTDFKDTIEVKHQQNIEIVAKIIKQGIEEDKIKSGNPADLATMILAVLFTPQTKELLDSEMVEEKINFIYNFIMNGISRKEI